MNRSNHFEQVNQSIKSSLKSLKFKSTDNVYLGTNLGGIFQKYNKELFNNDTNLDLKKIRLKCAEVVFNCLKNYFYNGTIIIPSFYFDYFRKKKFHKSKTSTTLGYFEKYFITQKKVARSNHPIFSIAAIGKFRHKIIEPCGPFSFGVNSPFNNFLDYNVKFLNLGIKFKDTCTYLHHLEHLNGVNHRYYKAVSGKVYLNNRYVKKIYYSLVRYNFLKSKKAEYKIEKVLKKNKSIFEENRFGLYASRIDILDIHSAALKKLYENPSYFMSKKTIVKLKD